MTDMERAVLIEKMMNVAQTAEIMNAHDTKAAALKVVKQQLGYLKK